MNKLIAITALLSFCAMANEPSCSTQTSTEDVAGQKDINTETPKNLKGATIIIRTADGKETSSPAEKFKVVPRKQQFITTKTIIKQITSCNVKPTQSRKNRVSILGGYGPRGGLKSSTNGSVAEVESKNGAIFGLQYQRALTDRISVGIQGQNNKTGSVVLGLDF